MGAISGLDRQKKGGQAEVRVVAQTYLFLMYLFNRHAYKKTKWFTPSSDTYCRVVAPVAFLAPAVQCARDRALRIDRIEVYIKAPQAGHMLEHFICLLIQGAPLELRMAQGQCPVIARVDRPHLYIRFAVAQVVLLGQLLAHVTVAGIVVDSGNGQFFILVIIEHGKEVKFAYQTW